MVERSPHGVWGGAERKGGPRREGRSDAPADSDFYSAVITRSYVQRSWKEKKKQDRRRRSSPLARSMYDVVVVVVVARVPPACLPGCLAFSPRAVASVVERKTRLNTITPYIIVVIHLP